MLQPLYNAHDCSDCDRSGRKLPDGAAQFFISEETVVKEKAQYTEAFRKQALEEVYTREC